VIKTQSILQCGTSKFVTCCGSDPVLGCSVPIFGNVAFLTHAADGVAVTITPPLRRVAALTRQNNITPASIELGFRQ
jgi:hypothetical protein